MLSCHRTETAPRDFDWTCFGSKQQLLRPGQLLVPAYAQRNGWQLAACSGPWEVLPLHSSFLEDIEGKLWVLFMCHEKWNDNFISNGFFTITHSLFEIDCYPPVITGTPSLPSPISFCTSKPFFYIQARMAELMVLALLSSTSTIPAKQLMTSPPVINLGEKASQ